MNPTAEIKDKTSISFNTDFISYLNTIVCIVKIISTAFLPLPWSLCNTWRYNFLNENYLFFILVFKVIFRLFFTTRKEYYLSSTRQVPLVYMGTCWGLCTRVVWLTPFISETKKSSEVVLWFQQRWGSCNRVVSGAGWCAMLYFCMTSGWIQRSLFTYSFSSLKKYHRNSIAKVLWGKRVQHLSSMTMTMLINLSFMWIMQLLNKM